MEVRQEIDKVKALLCRGQELDCLEELTGAEKPEGLLESPEDDASVLLTQSDSEIEVTPDIPVDVGYMVRTLTIRWNLEVLWNLVMLIRHLVM